VTKRPDWRLKPLQVPELPGEIDLAGNKSVWTFGRDPSNDIVCSAPSVSGSHARLELGADGSVWIEDLQSRNGTHVAGEAVVRARLRNGDVFQLGRAGPRFALVTVGGLDETVYVPKGGESEGGGKSSGRGERVGPETMQVVRSAMGLSGDERVEDIFVAERRRSVRRQAIVSVVLLVLIVSVVTWFATDFGKKFEQQDSRQAELERRVLEQVQDRLTGIESEFARVDERSRNAIADQKKALQEQLVSLRAQIEGREEATDELGALRAELAETERRLESLDPIRVEQERLRRVADVERAVVLIEVTLGFRHSLSGRDLYVVREASGLRPNFDGEGQRFVRESSGSGFVVDDKGLIVTNAHVVHKKGELTEGFGGTEPVLELQVVFSNTSRRIPAELLSFDVDDDNDLAILKIEPFPDMPNLGGIDLDLPAPDRGTDVFVLGFPLGTSALQPDDEVVVASTFRGILSRSVGDFLQVDAAVHPGNSGGPVIDRDGRVIGVVVGQQRLGGELGASDIGYVIPITRLHTIWPPR
jgi:S1-C subfamily serine protease